MKTNEISEVTKKLIEGVRSEQQRFDRVELLDNLRNNALKKFAEQGIPGKKSEAYKYSNPEKLFKSGFHFFNSVENISFDFQVSEYLIPGLDAHLIFTVNGTFIKDVSSLNNLPKGVIISTLSEAVKNNSSLVKAHFGQLSANTKDPFSTLNSALTVDGLFIYVPEKTIVEKPIHIINLISAQENSFINPHHLFIVSKNASVSFIESQTSAPKHPDSICNNQSSVVVEENARAQYYIIQNDENISRINAINASQAANSHFDTCTITINANWVRNNLNISLNGKNCETHLNGLFVLDNKQHLDNHTLVDHRMPNCESNQLYKGILNDSSTGIFNGKIFVQPDAQKTNAYQSSKNILLNDNATMNAKPELEIYANDVKCSHGSSTGKIDEEALFYLRSRGIGIESARTIMLGAFAGDVIEKIKIEPLKNYVTGLVEKKISGDNSKK
jgi:Fe-S cluster assembly protein SufD